MIRTQSRIGKLTRRFAYTADKWINPARGISSFTYRGPAKLDDIIKKEAFAGKSKTEVADIWYTYHEEKENVIGLVLPARNGKLVFSRASSCSFFIQPIFREDGYFMLMSQFEEPCHFLLAYLEDYKMDPFSASPLITVSLFDDFADDKNITLVRCNILNQNIAESEARKVSELLLENYQIEEESNDVIAFNKTPNQFDLDNFISRMKYRWTAQPPSVDL